MWALWDEDTYGSTSNLVKSIRSTITKEGDFLVTGAIENGDYGESDEKSDDADTSDEESEEDSDEDEEDESDTAASSYEEDSSDEENSDATSSDEEESSEGWAFKYITQNIFYAVKDRSKSPKVLQKVLYIGRRSMRKEKSLPPRVLYTGRKIAGNV